MSDSGNCRTQRECRFFKTDPDHRAFVMDPGLREAAGPVERVGLMSSCKARAEEIMMEELICVLPASTQKRSLPEGFLQILRELFSRICFLYVSSKPAMLYLLYSATCRVRRGEYGYLIW